MIELIYSIDRSDYLTWQADLLEWSVRRVGMQSQITRLTATAPDAADYACLNRFFAIVNEWRESDAETVVILDPDMVFVRPLDVIARRGVLAGHPYSYIFDLIWCPLVLHRDELRAWALRGLELSRALHKAGSGWISEMWAGNISANERKMSLRRQQTAVLNCEARIGAAPIIHYCYDSGGFHKQRYRRGQRVASHRGSEVQQRLAETINAYVEEQSPHPVDVT